MLYDVSRMPEYLSQAYNASEASLDGRQLDFSGRKKVMKDGYLLAFTLREQRKGVIRLR